MNINLYLLAFVIYAVCILPVSVHVRAEAGEGVHMHVSFHAAGIRIGRKHNTGRKGKETWDPAMISALLSEGGAKRVLKAFRLREAKIHIHISHPDASVTALTYALASVIADTIRCCVKFPVSSEIRMDFNASGSRAAFECIADTRAGIISAAALRLWADAAAARIRLLKAEEEKYAASH